MPCLWHSATAELFSQRNQHLPLSCLAPQSTAVPPPRGHFGKLQVLSLVMTMIGGGDHWHLVEGGPECKTIMYIPYGLHMSH